MLPLAHLWLSVVLAAGAVFLVSSFTHMVLKWHNADYRPLADEASVRAALGSPEPGQYVLPHCLDPRAEGTQARFEAGPVALLWIKAPGFPAMGKSLGGWFVYTLLVSFCVAYLTSRTVPGGAPFLQVLRVAGTAAWLAYGVANWPNVIWMGKPWKVALKETVDALFFALATGAVFGGFWPR